jgi:hypothetical protein
MNSIALIAIAAGCASALMFASKVSGALISLLLFNLAPLPLMVAALGWGPLCATIGSIAAAGGLAAIFGLPYCIAFIVSVALPACWLGHLVLLGRPIDAGTQAGNEAALEWYPVGRILLWIVVFATITTGAILLTMGSDGPAITGTMRALWMRVLQAIGFVPTDRMLDILVTIAPAIAAMATTLMLTFNLWLAAKITATSGRLHRPWPDLKAATLPPMTLAVLCAILAVGFADGLPAILARITSAGLLMAYAFIGFAVLHTLTLASNSRALWLICAYLITVIFTWAVLLMIVLGLLDSVFGIRRRFLRGRPPLPAS